MHSELGFNMFPFTTSGQNFAPFYKDLGFTSFLICLTTVYFVVPSRPVTKQLKFMLSIGMSTFY